MSHQFTVSDLPQSRKRLEITEIDAKTLEKSEKKALQEFSKEMKIKGFRPGHVPEEMVREQIHAEYLKGRTIEMSIPEAANGIIQEQGWRVISKPEVSIESLEPLKIVIETDVYPSVKVGDFSKIKVKSEKKEVGDKEVEDAIKDLQRRMSEFKAVDRASKSGDRITVDFEGFDAEGNALPNTKSTQHPVLLGSKSMIPGFEEELEGLKKGDEKSFEITFPKDYHAAEMASKKVTFKIQAHEVEEVMLPEVTEEFVEKVTGEKGDKKVLESKIREEIQNQYNRNAETEREDQFYEQLIKLVEAEIPKTLLDQEKQAILREVKQKILYQGLSYEKYLETLGKNEEELLESFEEQALGRMKLQLAFAQISEEKQIEVTDLEVEEHLNKMVERYPEENRAEVKKHYAHGTEAHQMISYQLKMQKVRDLLLPKV